MVPAIKVENLSKLYRIGATQQRHDTLRDALVDRFRRWRRRDGAMGEENFIWALKDVSFEVQPGEVLGIIGRNGAGKSTLLKILSRITEPTSGRAIINGRVGSLLEVGTGFHPELTGRENIYLNGAILGMRRREIDRKFDEIVAFSEIEKFLDTPVKRYSSGMYVRLAFAVAAHLEPEILLVDEVLAVGDAAFQKKCLGKMGEVARLGRTILFVSHNLVAIQNLCQRALWIDNGREMTSGSTEMVVTRYLQSSYQSLKHQKWEDLKEAPGNEFVRLREVAIWPVQGFPGSHNCCQSEISMQSPLRLVIEFWNLQSGHILHSTLHVLDEHGVTAFSTFPDMELVRKNGKLPVGIIRMICHIPANLLNAGVYRINLLIVQDGSKVIFFKPDVLMFEVLDLAKRTETWLGREPGVVHPKLNWEVFTIPQIIS